MEISRQVIGLAIEVHRQSPHSIDARMQRADLLPVITLSLHWPPHPSRSRQLEPFLRQTDIAVCLLPLTQETEGIFCARSFAMMPRGAMLVNVGRGKHVVEADLLSALDSGQLAYAALDALWPEPLPSTSPLWLHPHPQAHSGFTPRSP